MQERILVIDDEPLILSSIEKALSRVGYEIVTTMDLNGFCTSLTCRKFDLIIMDLHMKGINTNELIIEAQRTLPSVKFLTISGSTTQAKNSKYFLQKPFKIDSLRQKVREILDEPSRY
ncbi:MAG: response regulator [Nitrospirae bacterium]|nr:response regulator [Nitrospirota bacterium]